MENLDPSSPPNQGWENGAFLPFARLHPWFGGDGGLLFHFILSKIVVLFGMTAPSWKSVEYVVSSFDAVVCAIDETKLWLSLSAFQTVLKTLVWAPTCVPGFECCSMIGPLKKALSICQSGWKEIRNTFPVIRWIRWGPRTRISALLSRRY